MAATAQKGAIDTVYDVLEQGADAIGAVLGVDMSEPAPPMMPSSRQLPAAQRGPWQIIEAIDAQTGEPVVTITNGVERRDCPSKKFALEVLAALHAKGAR